MLSYTTAQGDTWDSISLKFYQNERYMHVLLERNPQYNDIVIFPANLVLMIPGTVQRSQSDYKPLWRKEHEK